MSTFSLRPYQTESTDCIANLFLGGLAWRQLLVLATGLGKTVVFSHLHQQEKLAAWLAGFPAQRQKILVIAHREELLTQAADKIHKANPDLRVEIEQATQHASPMADVIVASVQTIASRSCRRLMRFNLEDFRFVIIDEAHHAIAKSYVDVLRAFGFMPPEEYWEDRKPQPKDSNEVKLKWQRDRMAAWDDEVGPEALLLGVTATPSRGDKVGLEAVFQQVAYSMGIREGIEQGYLSPIRAYRVLTNTSLEGVGTRAGDFAIDQLSQAIDNEERNYQAVAAYKQYASGRQGVGFCASVAHALHMALCFNKAGIPAAHMHGNMSTEDRKLALERFANGEIRILTNAMLLTEGWDAPNVGCIIQARPTQSQSLYVQMAGRGTRLAPGKEDCILIDLVDVTRKHSLMTSADLVGLPHDFDAKGKDLLEVAKAIEEAKAAHPGLIEDDIKSLDDLAVKVEEVELWNSHLLPEITTHTTLAWRKNSDGDYMLHTTDEHARPERLLVTRDGTGWCAEMEKFGQKQLVVPQQPTLSGAFREAEAWMRRRRPASAKRADRSMNWRKEPISQLQVDALAGFKLPLDVSKLSKGEASDLIDHARFEKQKKAKPFAVVGKKAS